MGTVHKLKHHTKRLFLLWRLVTVIIISSALIPLFLANKGAQTFYLGTVSASLIGFLLLSIVQLGLKKGVVRRYFERTSLKLLFGFVLLTAAFLAFQRFQDERVGRALLIASAIAYALFLQKISFFKVILP